MQINPIEYTIRENLYQSFEKFADLPFLSFTDETPKTYAEVRNDVEYIQKILISCQVAKGDKIALLSGNMPNWSIIYFAVTTMGAVIVPILPDFSSEEVEQIIEHSESKILFVSELQLPKIKSTLSSKLVLQVKVNDLSIMHSVYELPENISLTDIPEIHVSEDDLATIIYTSGTTGNSKGVMLSHKNIVHNAEAGGILQKVNKTDRFLSLLPLSHTYENTLGLILPMLYGASVYYLKKLPTPNVLIPAMQAIRPTLILSVPLIIEKIYKNKILPTIHSKTITKLLYKIPVFRKMINKAAGRKLYQTFGGKLKFFGIGGSKLDPVVERFLLEAEFPYAIGYGLTETAPLLAGVNPQTVRWQSTGPAVNGVELKLDNINPTTGEGEILAKGPNVMKGYYKNPTATQEVFTEDGWFRTGDLASFDKNGYVFIKGRLKNVIIGSSGENIYPEEIESLINNYNFVIESLVMEQKGKLVAFVHFNMEELSAKYQNLKSEVTHYMDEKIQELSEELKLYINSKVSTFSSIKMIVAQHEPFEKTPTQKIKRYKYLSR